jgi:hypothetical protein
MVGLLPENDRLLSKVLSNGEPCNLSSVAVTCCGRDLLEVYGLPVVGGGVEEEGLGLEILGPRRGKLT